MAGALSKADTAQDIYGEGSSNLSKGGTARYIYDEESNTSSVKARNGHFKSICTSFCIFILLIFMFLYEKYTVQELHVVDNMIRLVLNSTAVNETT